VLRTLASIVEAEEASVRVPIIMTVLASTACVASHASLTMPAANAEAAHASGVRPVVEQYAALPLVFEPAPAMHGKSRFVSHGAHYAIALSTDGAQLAWRPPRDVHVPETGFAIRFVAPEPHTTIAGALPQPTRIHHVGDPNGPDRTDVPTYARVVVSGVYRGIDVAFHGRGGELEYDVIVAPGSDPSRFALRVDEGVDVALDDAGGVRLTAPGGSLTLRRPVAYQDVDGMRTSVTSEFVIEAGRDVRFRLGDYDRQRALVVDPVVSYATYVGGSAFEQGSAIAVDASGSAYVAGYTASPDFPLVTALDRSIGRKGDVDVFVSKLNASGTALVWSTYIGGSASGDRAIGIAVDAAGSAYVAGNTTGTDFPTTPGAWQRTSGGSAAFVAKLAPGGNALAYSTYVAGAAANAIAIDSSGHAFVAGSANPSFSATSGALQALPGNASKTGFVLKLDAAGSAPSFATFLGGSGSDEATSIAVDAQGSAYVGGWTTSGDFPLVGALQSTARGGKEAFVAKLDATGSRLAYSTLLGGALDDAVNAIAVDGGGSAYVAGETYSPDFPVKDGFQMRKAGANLVNSSVGNAFVAKLAPAGDALVYASFLGGEVCLTLCELVFGPQPQFNADAAFGIAVDASGHAFVSGIAKSYTFPLIDSTASRKQDDREDSAFVSKVAISGRSLLWSTFVRTGFGEGSNPWTRFPFGAATGIAVDPAGAAYVTGDADQFSVFSPSPGAFQTDNGFSASAVVTKFAAAPAMTLTASNERVDAPSPVALTATLAGSALGNVIFMDGATAIGSAPLSVDRATLTVTLPQGIHALTALLRVPGSASDTPVLYQVVDAPLSCTQ
jgi:hypothetical protein